MQHLQRAIALGKQGQYEQAISEFNKAIGLDPQLAKAYNKLVAAYYLQKDYDNAWKVTAAARRKGLVNAISPRLLEDLKRDSGREK